VKCTVHNEKTCELITNICSGRRSFGFSVSELERSEKDDVLDVVGVGPGEGRGSNHGSYRSTLLIGIGAYVGGGGEDRRDSCKQNY
jgi:hypothetical protein